MIVNNFHVWVFLVVLIVKRSVCTVKYSYIYGNEPKVLNAHQLAMKLVSTGFDCKAIDVKMIIEDKEIGCQSEVIENKVCAGFCRSVFVPTQLEGSARRKEACSSCYKSQEIDFPVYLKCKDGKEKVNVTRILGCSCTRFKCIRKALKQVWEKR